MKNHVRKVLDSLYHDIGQPYALSSPRKLYEAARSKGISESDVVKYISSQDDYTLHKPVRLNYPRNKIIIGGPRKTLVSDLAELTKLSESNDDVKYLMVIMDGFSRYLKVYPLKNKRGKTTAHILNKAFNDPDFKGVTHLFTDAGSEYLNKDTKKVYKENRITQYSTHNTVFKTSLAERVIRTLKQKIFRYLTFNNTERYIDVLPDLIKSYNLSTHRILNDSPMEVHMKYNKASICINTTTVL